MKLTVVSDWHLGAVRSAGTTPATALQLRQDLLTRAEEILCAINNDLLVNGDLFDGPDISKADLLRAVQIFGDWLTRQVGHLYLSNGNHDLSKTSTNFSSFQFFAALLIEMHGAHRVTHITEGTTFSDPHTLQPLFHVIPHVLNQDTFNLELSRVPACPYLFVHANYDNGFAVESDHSLNMSEEQAIAAPVEHIIFGHEHQAKTALKGKVIIVGNQFPSSVSDCLGNDDKQVLKIIDDGPMLETCWEAHGDFSEQDWRALEDTGRFIRVTGEASAEEAAAVVTAISRFRSTAKALVITNAVKIAGVNDSEELVLSHEAVTAFNVREALRDLLTPEENEKIDNLKVSK